MVHRLYQLGRQGLLCAATACCAMAIENPQVGVQALGSWPTGAMRSEFAANTGYGIGLFAGWELGAGKALRLAYDGLWYPHGGNSESAGPPSTALREDERKARSHSLTAQYLYYPSGDIEGVYFKVGVGAMNDLTRIQSTLTVPGSPAVEVTVLDESGTKLATLAGLGYDFDKHWGVMAQYSFITVANRTLGAVQTGVSYRF